jgi:hypothetical protein
MGIVMKIDTPYEGTIKFVYDGLTESVRRVNNFPKPENQIKEQVVYDLKNESRELIKVGDCFQSNEGYVVKVLDYVNKNNVYVEFQDKDRARCWFRTVNLRSGKFKNPYHRSVLGVGYLGEGIYRCSKDSKLTVVYVIWNSMLSRCYCEKYQTKKPSYIGCTVHEEWHNFQVFAEWFYSYPKYFKGCELDKDILVKGNKVYSAETCCLVPKEINSFFVNVSENSGVHYNKGSGKFVSRVSVGGKRNFIGSFDCKVEALKAYKKAKEAEAKILAEYWKGKIDVLVYNKLMKWEFN